MKKIAVTLACLIMVSTVLHAQKAVVGTPYSFTHNNVSMVIDRVDLPTVDADKLLAEDALADKGTPLRVGTVHNVNYNFHNSGRLDEFPDGSRLWRLSFRSPGAVMMAVIFSHFNIPEEATFHIYSGDRSQLTGTYTNKDFEQVNGLMASEDIIGDEVILEYYEPASALYHGEIQIERISHIYRDFLHVRDDNKGHWGDADGDCHYDVVCPEGKPWHTQINSVVCISITDNTGSYLCSGAMINNIRKDRTPYVLSANHCYTGAPNAGTFKFYFLYQTFTCGGNNGYYNRMANGATVVASAGGTAYNTSPSSDFLLLRITGNLYDQYRDSIVFAGWDATGSASVGAAIHHPGGDYKKISFPRTVSSNYGSYFWVVNWYTNPNKGCTEQGSSGSPLFNAQGLIIGDLSSGSSACDYPMGVDYYGKLSHSWNNGNTSNNNRKLKPWLDPDNTGILKMNSMRYDGTPVGVENYTTTIRPFNIVPNPSQGFVSMKGSFDPGDGVCNVYNAMGVLVASKSVTLSPSIDMSFNDLPSGIYIVEIINDNHIYKSKMVIAR
ncbi:MAG: T9SS type A sorting domain-containing protein [Bacteroidales bacterium]|nr:T9SS type A sorting domain-containing protein [Bacteroidales bacterium]